MGCADQTESRNCHFVIEGGGGGVPSTTYVHPWHIRHTYTGHVPQSESAQQGEAAAGPSCPVLLRTASGWGTHSVCQDITEMYTWRKGAWSCIVLCC